jgi:hypothetical protein
MVLAVPCGGKLDAPSGFSRLEELQTMSRPSLPTRGEFAMRTTNSRPLRFPCGAAIIAGCLALGCSLSPVVTVPQIETTPYDDCERAAEDYCELVIGAGDADLESCVANYTFQCISGLSE